MVDQQGVSPTFKDLDRSSVLARRLNGSYYTTEAVAHILTEWAVAGRATRVLDPSFGGCAFLRSALQCLGPTGSAEAGSSIFGVDIDPKTRPYADELHKLGVPSDNLRLADFFTFEPEELGGAFDAVIGNPPYVRHHLLDASSIERGQKRASDAGISLDRRADLWAYFVAHALRFVAPGGRLALLLPGAVLQANYAKPLLERLEATSGDVHLVSVRQRLFSDTSERTVVLLAADVWRGTCHLELRDVRDTSELRDVLPQLARGPWQGERDPVDPDRNQEPRGRRLGLDSRVIELYEELADLPTVRALGDLARVRLGVVTGANRFFVRKPSEVGALLSRGVRTVPVVGRASWLSAPSWRPMDQQLIEGADRANQLLVVSPGAVPSKTLAEEIDAAEDAGWHERHHCSRRKSWYVLSDTAIPSAFLPYMGARPPRLVINRARSTSTNAVHRVEWRRSGLAKRSIAGSWTTLFGLSVELSGRSYGGGVLKLEPGEAVRTMVPLAASSEDLAEIDEMARSAGRQAAVNVADRLVLRHHLGLTLGEVDLLREAESELALRRG